MREILQGSPKAMGSFWIDRHLLMRLEYLPLHQPVTPTTLGLQDFPALNLLKSPGFVFGFCFGFFWGGGVFILIFVHIVCAYLGEIISFIQRTA